MSRFVLRRKKSKRRKTPKQTFLVISDGTDRNSRHDFDKMQGPLRGFDVQSFAIVFDKTK
jgi:hypothetical protein